MTTDWRRVRLLFPLVAFVLAPALRAAAPGSGTITPAGGPLVFSRMGTLA